MSRAFHSIFDIVTLLIAVTSDILLILVLELVLDVLHQCHHSCYILFVINYIDCSTHLIL